MYTFQSNSALKKTKLGSMGFFVLFSFLSFIFFLKGLFASIVSHISQNGTEKLTTIWVEKRGV